ncbi:MAG: hypothetical protein AAGM38_03980 [Pseudomonadota bacterium]
MKSFMKSFLGVTAALVAGAAAAHETALPHMHPHPEMVGGDTLIVLAIMVGVGAALWLRRGAK